MDNRQRPIGFIGIGVLGKGLALALAGQGYVIAAAQSRTPASSHWLTSRLPNCAAFNSAQALADHCDVVFITTPDSVIGSIAQSVRWRAGQGVVHCSGALPLSVLDTAAKQGALTGGFHPFQTFAGMDSPEGIRSRLEGVSFAVAGGGWLASFLDGAARDLGGRAVAINESNRSLYHAAAILGCGYLSALLHAGLDCLRGAGFSPEEALDALVPLAAATVDNIRVHGILPSVTGPAVRGDVATMKSHLEALTNRVPHAVPVYQALTAVSIPIAAQRGVGEELLREMARLAAHNPERTTECPE